MPRQMHEATGTLRLLVMYHPPRCKKTGWCDLMPVITSTVTVRSRPHV